MWVQERLQIPVQRILSKERESDTRLRQSIRKRIERKAWSLDAPVNITVFHQMLNFW